MSLNVSEFFTILLQQGGSDLHLVVGSPPRIRIDGQLKPLDQPALSADQMNQLVQEIIPPQQQGVLKEQREVDWALSLPDIGRFRLHLYRQRGSWALAIRAVSDQIPTFEQLGLPSNVADLLRKPQGLILVTGPTGSGKSTTLAAMVDWINRDRRGHIVTLEDPIEVLHRHQKSLVTQLEIGSDVVEYHQALRGLLRQDPDVVVLGELRDLDTIQSAMTLAETGHLTIATVHTNSAIQTLTRLVSVFPSHQQQEVRVQLSMVLVGVLAQRLLPKSQEKGRVMALEILVPTPAIRNLIREDKIHQIYSMMQTGQAQYGIQTLNQGLADLCQQNLISVETALGATTHAEEFTKLLERMGRERPQPISLARLRNRGSSNA